MFNFLIDRDTPLSAERLTLMCRLLALLYAERDFRLWEQSPQGISDMMELVEEYLGK